MSDSKLEELARDAHEAWPNGLSFPEVFSMLAGWTQRGRSAPQNERERAWLAGLQEANQILYREVMALVPLDREE